MGDQLKANPFEGIDLDLVCAGLQAAFAGEPMPVTRPEMEDAGFEVELVSEEYGDPNPLTHKLSFRLEARKGRERRVFFEYHEWTSWAHSTLVAFATLLGLESYYYHSEEEEFLPVSDWRDDADCEENVTFMLFRRPRR